MNLQLDLSVQRALRLCSFNPQCPQKTHACSPNGALRDRMVYVLSHDAVADDHFWTLEAVDHRDGFDFCTQLAPVGELFP